MIKTYSIDDVVVGSRKPRWSDNGKIILSPYNDTVFSARLEQIFSTHDISKESILLKTCEGFNTEHNLEVIASVANKIYGKKYRNRIIFRQGSMTFHRHTPEYDGILIFPDVSFPIHECRTQFYGYKDNQVEYYNRNYEKTFCVLYARGSYDRHYIFDHLFKNHFDTSVLIYANVDSRHYEKYSYFNIENHINKKYNSVYANSDDEYNADDTARYVLDDMNQRASQCFLNVVSETNFYENDSCWFTEKTVAPIIAGFPFITSTTCGYYDLLKDFGFKTFSDFWDESFNNDPDHYARARKMTEVLDDIAKRYDTPSKRQRAIEQMRPILDHNRERMFDLLDPNNENMVEDILGFETSRQYIRKYISDF